VIGPLLNNLLAGHQQIPLIIARRPEIQRELVFDEQDERLCSQQKCKAVFNLVEVQIFDLKIRLFEASFELGKGQSLIVRLALSVASDDLPDERLCFERLAELLDSIEDILARLDSAESHLQDPIELGLDADKT